MLSSLFGVVAEVGGYWQEKAYGWWTTKSPRSELLDRLENAASFEEWEQAALQLDETLGYDLWRQNASSKHYDYRLIYERQQAIIAARDGGGDEDGYEADVAGLVGLLRAGLVRNLGNITAPALFNRAYAGTKLLIEDYITQVALAIEYVTALPTGAHAHDYVSGSTRAAAAVAAEAAGSGGGGGGWSAQSKLDLLHDTRQAFGRSTLVLQGGAIFGLCHLGVVKALHLRGLLPRIITGTATGALVAALVGVHTEDELLDFLDSDGIDFAAFAHARSGLDASEGEGEKMPAAREGQGEGEAQQAAWTSLSALIDTLSRRTIRYMKEGYFLDVGVLEDFVRAHVGDTTFLEAYARTKRVLNITVATAPSGHGGVPTLLNYLTAPNVLICSAAVASNSSGSATDSSGRPLAPTAIQCKDEHGIIRPWSEYSTGAQDGVVDALATSRPGSSRGSGVSGASATTHSHPSAESPLARVASLFNVNHFIVSQARPYVVPFISAPAAARHAPPHPTLAPSPLLAPLLRLAAGEVHHRLTQLGELGLLPPTLRKLLLDEEIPNTGPASSITLVPSIGAADYLRLLDRPGRAEVEHWMRRGERSVWPAVSALRIRCAVEVELDRGYQLVRRRKPLDGDFGVARAGGGGGGGR